MIPPCRVPLPALNVSEYDQLAFFLLNTTEKSPVFVFILFVRMPTFSEMQELS